MRLVLSLASLLLPLTAQELITPIHDIQGAGLTTPLAGRTVTTSGIVTARRTSGFFIQARDAEWDNDSNTSEGLYVFTSTTPPAGALPGTEVRVTGPVSEFGGAGLSLTQIARPTDISIVSTGNPLPVSLALGRVHALAGWGFQNLERFEGMRVHGEGLIAVAPTGGFVDERTASATNNGILTVVFNGTPPPRQSAGFTGAPELLRVDTSTLAVPWIAQAGQFIDRVSGVLDFGSGTWTVLQDNQSARPLVPLAPPVRLIPPSAREFTVLSLNAERFFNDVDDPGLGEPVLRPDAFQLRLNKLAMLIRDVAHSPDIVCLQEVENSATLDAVARKLGGDYLPLLEEGNDVGGIDVGFLVRTDRVRIRSVAQEGKDTQYTRPDGRLETLNDRPPLVLRASVEGRFPVTVIVNHFRSRVDLDDPIAGPRIRLKRRLQAEFLAGLVQRLARETPQESIVAAGDFNTYEFESEVFDPLTRQAGMALLTQWLPVEWNRSYIFQGVAQTIDHILVNGPARSAVSRIQYTQVNAAAPEAWRGMGDRPERLSDHDGAMATFSIDPASFTAAGVTSNVSFLGGPVVPGEVLAVFGANLPTTPGFRVNGAPVESIFVSTSQHNILLPALVPDGPVVLELGERREIIATTRLKPAIAGVDQRGAVLTLSVNALSGSGYRAGVSLAGRDLEILSARPIAPENPLWVLEVLVPPDLPRNTALPLVVSADGFSTPRDFTVRLP